MAVNAWRARALMKVARETKSQALEADSLHFASDFFGSIPVIAGLALSAYGYEWADPVAALVVAVLISILGFRMVRRTVATLVDTAPEGAADKVEAAIRKVAGVVNVERVRVRMVGPRYFIDAAVKLPRTFPSDQIAKVKAAVQQAVTGLFDEADVTVVTTPIALDNESMMDRVLVIARNRALAVHHVTVHDLKGRLAVSLDLEVDGGLTLRAAHELADGLEAAIAAELGPGVEVETHIEPLQPKETPGREAPPERVKAVAKHSSGFIYLVSLTGVTGERQALPSDLEAQIRTLRLVTTKPVCVGFGISTPAHVAEVVRYADGAIVGSAIVRLVESLAGDPALVRKVGDFVAALKAAAVPPRG